MKSLALFCCLLPAALCTAQNTQVSAGVFFDGEPYIAQHPQNPQHLVVAWMGKPVGQPVTIRTRVSFDGGVSWSPVVNLPHAASGYGSADPSLAFDADGQVVACYIDYINDPVEGGVYFVRSEDGGLSWGAMVKAIDAFDDGTEYPIDRPWFSVNPLTNHFYLTTMSAYWGPTPNYPYFTVSPDGGATWGELRRLDGPGWLTGSEIGKPMPANATGSDGVFHAIYPSWVISQNVFPGMIHAASADHGENFAYNGAIYATGGANNDPGAKNGYRLAADPSDPGHLALLLIQSPETDQDVYLMESSDGGLNWDPLIRVNDDAFNNDRMQDLVWAAFDSDGDLAIAWRDRRNAPEAGYATAQEIYGAVKWKNTDTVGPNFPISSSAAPWNALFLEQNGNDFLCLTMHDDTLNTVWGDVRGNTLKIWFQRTAAQTGTPVSVTPIAEETIPLIRLFPNPASDRLRVEGEWTDCRIADASGRIVKTVSRPSDAIGISELAAGSYTALFRAPGGKQHVRFEVVR
jgi:hypothetical protein